jgi:wobble nucleotide-excising tRNase
LTRLNVDDFTGIIKIYLDRYNDLKIELQDKNGRIITNPNTSLLTTMHISILFAISELTRENRNADYPLIFDAPTSSFDEGKDKTFYECLNSQVNKQCIVVTKSYLYKNDSGEYVTDTKSLNSLNCQKYRIRKLSGFDKLDITTIDTQIEAIN